MDAYKQIELIPFLTPDDAEKEKCYTPDFSAVNKLYQEFGINNEIDLAMQKPQYRSIIDQRLQELPINPSPNLPDDVLLENMPSRELDANELREVAIHYAKENKKTKND